jgi:hypothetical protein
MGGDLFDFPRASMWDFQTLRSVFSAKHGLKEEHEMPTTKDMDALYAKIPAALKKAKENGAKTR